MNTEEMMIVMAGYNNGKNIQMRETGGENEWKVVHDPSWDWDGYEYRLFIQNIDAKYWEFLKDNVWQMTDKRYAEYQIKEMSNNDSWDKYYPIDALGIRTIEDDRKEKG